MDTIKNPNIRISKKVKNIRYTHKNGKRYYKNPGYKKMDGGGFFTKTPSPKQMVQQFLDHYNIASKDKDFIYRSLSSFGVSLGLVNKLKASYVLSQFIKHLKNIAKIMIESAKTNTTNYEYNKEKHYDALLMALVNRFKTDNNTNNNTKSSVSLNHFVKCEKSNSNDPMSNDEFQYVSRSAQYIANINELLKQSDILFSDANTSKNSNQKNISTNKNNINNNNNSKESYNSNNSKTGKTGKSGKIGRNNKSGKTKKANKQQIKFQIQQNYNLRNRLLNEIKAYEALISSRTNYFTRDMQYYCGTYLQKSPSDPFLFKNELLLSADEVNENKIGLCPYESVNTENTEQKQGSKDSGGYNGYVESNIEDINTDATPKILYANSKSQQQYEQNPQNQQYGQYSQQQQQQQDYEDGDEYNN